MDLLFLYGIPGVGKLTVAKHLLNKLDNYKLFHNQMTMDIISPIIPFPHPKNFELNGKYRKLMYKACIELGINLVTTFVYAFKEDDEYIKNILDMYHQGGGEVKFVHLTCDLETIFERIQNEDRKKHRKVSKPESLKETMSKWDITKAIPFVNNFEVDTTNILPDKTAEAIIKYFNL